MHERARLAIDEMVEHDIKMKLANGEPVSGTKEDMIMGSELPSAVARNDANTAAMMATMPLKVPGT